MEIGINNTTYLTFLFCLYLVFFGLVALVVSKIYNKSFRETATNILRKGVISTIKKVRAEKA